MNTGHLRTCWMTVDDLFHSLGIKNNLLFPSRLGLEAATGTAYLPNLSLERDDCLSYVYLATSPGMSRNALPLCSTRLADCCCIMLRLAIVDPVSLNTGEYLLPYANQPDGKPRKAAPSHSQYLPLFAH